MNEKKPEGIGIGDIVRYNDKIKGIVVRIFSGYRQREMVDIMTCHTGEPRIFTAYTDELAKTGEHLTEMVYILRYLNRSGRYSYGHS